MLIIIKMNIRKYRESTDPNSSGLSVPGLPLCSLGIMKDAWDRLRQCISPSTSMTHCGNSTLPILNQVFHFVCGSLIHLSPSSPTLPGGHSCSQADPKAIAFAILQQQQRAEVIQISSFKHYRQTLIITAEESELQLFIIAMCWFSSYLWRLSLVYVMAENNQPHGPKYRQGGVKEATLQFKPI